jgi:hypothetical protein
MNKWLLILVLIAQLGLIVSCSHEGHQQFYTYPLQVGNSWKMLYKESIYYTDTNVSETLYDTLSISVDAITL